jgi:hypothetical protein
MQAVALLVVGLVGVWISARQMVIANDRLQMDKFDRLYAKRVTVYEATRKILAQVFETSVSDIDLRAYGLIALDSQFLFDDSMYQYLREIRQRIVEINLINSQPPADTIPGHDDYRKRKSDNMNWLIAQGDEHSGFAAKFRPFLVHDLPRRAWLLRWPE